MISSMRCKQFCRHSSSSRSLSLPLAFSLWPLAIFRSGGRWARVNEMSANDEYTRSVVRMATVHLANRRTIDQASDIQTGKQLPIVY